MLKNYIKIALRHLGRHRSYTVINVAGLAIGIATCLLILLYVQEEVHYDRFHDKADRIYRIVHDRALSGSEEHLATVPLALGPALRQDFPEVAGVVRLLRDEPPVIAYRDRQFTEENIFYADPALFEVFSFRFRSGSPETALADPNGIVLTETMARQYFGDEDPVGEVLTYTNWGNEYAYAVSAVLEDVPAASHVHFDALVPFESPQNLWHLMHGQDWNYSGSWTYVLLAGAQAAPAFEAKLAGFVERHVPEVLRTGTTLRLQPLLDIHLHSRLAGEIEANGSPLYVYVFAAVALLVLLIACINFMNLATARSAQRAREVSLRKVLGAPWSHLIRQFLGEALLLSFLAVGLAVVLVALVLPAFNGFTGKTLSLGQPGMAFMPAVLVGIGLVVGFVSGSYPAFFLSAFEPAAVLKGATAGLPHAAPLRKALVVFQFVISILLLVGMGVIVQQLDFMRTKDLGFDQEEVVFIRRRAGQNIEAFKTKLLAHPKVERAVGARAVPGSVNAAPITFNLFRAEGMEAHERKQMPATSVGYGYLDLFGLNLVAGRDFSPDIPTDSAEALILNETAVRELGWQGGALGKTIDAFDMLGNFDGTGRVVGVVKDYHFESLHHPVKPLVLSTNGRGYYGNVVLRLAAGSGPDVLDFIAQTWHDVVPEAPLELFFLNADLQRLYRQERQVQRIMGYFTGLALFIGCLGLFGLAAFTVEQRTREIGVRKVLGASVAGLVALLSKDFLKLVALAYLLAVPVAYLAMERWLEGFAYRVEVSWLLFAGAGVAAVGIALLTVSYQAVRAALADPVQALRYE